VTPERRRPRSCYSRGRHSAGGTYVNFIMEEGQERVRASFGENYDRLAAMKRRYDPTDFFRVNQNIRPA